MANKSNETPNADAESKPKRPPIGPRPAYVLINLPEGVSVEDIEVVATTRKAEEALAAIDGGTAGKYLRVMVK